MRITTPRALVATGAVAALIGATIAFAPALPGTADAPAVTAESLGLDFAPMLVAVAAADQDARSAIAALGLDLVEHADADGVKVVLHTAADAAILSNAGYEFTTLVADMIAAESQRQSQDAAFAEANPVTELPSGRNAYRVLSDFGAEIDQLVSDNPTLAKRISIGRSVEGRDLTGIEIGADVTAREDGRPVLLMFGAHHAREWPSAEAPMEFAHDLLAVANDASHPNHDRVLGLLDAGRVIIVPVSNPDGYDLSRTSGDIHDLTDPTFDPAIDIADDAGGIAGIDDGTVTILATPGHAYKRKNCRFVDGQDQPAGACILGGTSNGGFGIGVDLNRNYGGLWGGPGADPTPGTATYRGPAPFSEPETQAIRSLISTRQVTTLISNHTFSNLLLRPVGVHPSTIGPDGLPVGFAPDECFTTADGSDYGMQALGERMTAQTGYSNQFGWELYDTTGTTEDYSYNATGGYGYTFEIGHQEFHPTYEGVVAEYLGTSDAATSVTPESAADLTSDAADDCAGDAPTHDTVGGGLAEAYLIALENAVNPQTHAVITGSAPQGATLTLERSGVFPLWDGTPFADQVATQMTAAGGSFEYHVNASTRPFVASRKAPVLTAPKDTLETTGFIPPTLGSQPTDFPFEVTSDSDALFATVQATASGSGLALNFREFELRLLAPGGFEIAAGTEFGASNTVSFTGLEGEGVPAGTYTLRVTNSTNPVGQFALTAETRDIAGNATPRSFETWTLRCVVDGVIAGSTGVQVERGGSADVGEICAG